MGKHDQSHSKGPSKRQELREKQRKTQKRGTILIISGIVLVAVIAVLAIIWPSLKPVGEVVTPEAVSRPQTSGLSMGDPNAPVKIVEFADFQCPACGYFVKSLEPQIIKDYIETGKVYFTFQPFSFIGQESVAAAEAAYCASDQGKFWEYHDIIYANQTQENGGDFTAKRLSAFAETIGLNMADFNSCFKSGKYTAQVASDAADARNQSVNSTPTFDVNGTKVEFNGLVDAINAAINAAQ